MNCIDEIFFRADIQNIREFLLNGTECVIDGRSYKERVDSACNQIRGCLRKHHSEDEDVMECVYYYGKVMQDIYMEIGLQVGATLAAQAYENRR